MAKQLTSKQYDSLVINMERMADGAAKHKSDEGFSNRLDEAQCRAQRQKLEDSRAKWESLVGEAERAYDEYAQYFAFCTAELAKNTDTMRGFYGKKTPMLSDYGIKVIDKTKKTAKKPAKPKS